jgi:hypothetical protein
MPHPLIELFGGMLERLVPGAGGRTDAASSDFELDPAQRASFAGRWETSFGMMELQQHGEEVRGWYGGASGWNELRGMASGARLQFEYRERAEAGSGSFELSADGKSFDGSYRANGTSISGGWHGRRLPPNRPFHGLWDSSGGALRLVRDGNEVRGLLQCPGSCVELTGSVEGDRCRLSAQLPTGAMFTAQLRAAGLDWFEGSHTVAPPDQGSKSPVPWNGVRKASRLAQRWLVVLEPHWEHHLADPEYSFGDMLRPYFKRMPHVRFRHRRVLGREDFLRHLREVAFLPEDAVIYVSSHGTRDGVAVPGGVVTATEIAHALRDVPNVVLLHFGGCNIASGTVPEDIVSAQPCACRFPVSGFCRFADWSGSAIVDYTYLTLVLERRLPPAAAVAATRDSVRFAGSAPLPGSTTVMPMDLRIVGG